jgi:diguanylate cyclase (GGDEF)-like protein
VATKRVDRRLALLAIDALDWPVVVCDARGELALVNVAARDLLGLAAEGGQDVPVGHDLARLADDDGRSSLSVTDALTRTLDGDEWRRAPRWLMVDGDAPRRVQVSTTALRDGAGEAVGAVMSVIATDDVSSGDGQLRTYASDMEMIEAVSRTLAELQDPDLAASEICTAALGMTGAVAVLLWDCPAGELVIRYSEGGLDGVSMTAVIDASRVGAVRAVAEVQTIIQRSGDGERSGEAIVDDRAGVTVGTIWHEPLVVGDHVTGVLSIAWDGDLADPDRPGLLVRSLAGHAATALERTALLTGLHAAARIDALTGVTNRRGWEESFDRELMRARRETRPLSVVLIDIDQFKAYNDRLGHPQGDQLLTAATDRWSRQLRPSDLLARVGGEEFAVLLPGCPTEFVGVVAERLRTVMPDGQTCSLGAVTWDGHQTPAELFAAADQALYRAKHNGRNQVHVVLSPPAAARAAAPDAGGLRGGVGGSDLDRR